MPWASLKSAGPFFKIDIDNMEDQQGFWGAARQPVAFGPSEASLGRMGVVFGCRGGVKRCSSRSDVVITGGQTRREHSGYG